MVFFGTIRQKALHQATSPKIYFFGRCDNLPILQDLVAEGYNITPEILARLGPFRTAHVNRFQKFSTAIFERIVAILLPPLRDRSRSHNLARRFLFRCRTSHHCPVQIHKRFAGVRTV
jgi:hypothetical protein